MFAECKINLVYLITTLLSIDEGRKHATQGTGTDIAKTCGEQQRSPLRRRDILGVKWNVRVRQEAPLPYLKPAVTEQQAPQGFGCTNDVVKVNRMKAFEYLENKGNQ